MRLAHARNGWWLPLCIIGASLGGVPMSAPVAANLYQQEQHQALVSDRKAYRIGDALTVLIVENASATSNAATSTEKSGSVNLAFKSSHSDQFANIDLSDRFGGKGQIQRSGKLLAQITVTITAIDPNTGAMSVAGEQLIAINDEKQEIKVQGKIRPVDIQENNTVLSTRLADARISYIGDGILAEKQHPGLLTRLLGWLGVL